MGSKIIGHFREIGSYELILSRGTGSSFVLQQSFLTGCSLEVRSPAWDDGKASLSGPTSLPCGFRWMFW